MTRKTVTLFLLPAFCLFTMSCVSTQVKPPSALGSANPRAAVITVITKSGETVEFRKGAPGRIDRKAAAVVGTTIRHFDVAFVDIDQLIKDEQGRVVRFSKKDGTSQSVASFVRDGEVAHVGAYVPVTIPFTDVQQFWVKRTDAFSSILGGSAIIAAAVVVVGIASLVAFVNLLKTSSCPYIYSWNGEEFVLDAEPYGAAISEGLKRTEWVELSELREFNGEYRLLLSNELDETDYTDELKLVGVDHAPGMRVVPDLSGRFHTFAAPVPPASAVDQTGRDILTFVQANDKAFWLSDLEGRDPDGEGEFRDELVFEFPKPAGARTAKLLANVWTTPWGSHSSWMFLEHYGTSLPEKYAEVDNHGPMYAKFVSWVAAEELAALKVWVETPAGWKARSMIMGGAPVITKDKACVLPVGDIPGETLRIMLRPPVNFWMVDSLAVDYGEDMAFEATELAAATAVDRAGRDVRQELAATDGSYLVSPARGDRTELVFAAPPLKPGLQRTLFVKASGYYRSHIDTTGAPRLDLAERVLTEPGFAARYSFREYLKWEAGLRAEAEKAKR
jgi:hypothetical protein